MCGAWHAPALQAGEHGAKSDDALLKGLKSRKTSATWIPWTAGRLSYRSGYGAGIASPGYYEHLWNSPGGNVGSRWLSHVARLLRSEDLDASPANVVEAVRVADTLAALSGSPGPGLEELREAALATLCGGETEKLALIRDKLEIGEKLGEVPAEAPPSPCSATSRGCRSACASSVCGRAQPRPRPARGERPRPQRAAPPSAPYRHRLGRAARGLRQERHVSRAVGLALASRALGGPDRSQRLGQHRRGRRLLPPSATWPKSADLPAPHRRSSTPPSSPASPRTPWATC